jgi:hypothetical protein
MYERRRLRLHSNESERNAKLKVPLRERFFINFIAALEEVLGI